MSKPSLSCRNKHLKLESQKSKFKKQYIYHTRFKRFLILPGRILGRLDLGSQKIVARITQEKSGDAHRPQHDGDPPDLRQINKANLQKAGQFYNLGL